MQAPWHLEASYAETPSSKPLKAESHLNLSLQIKKGAAILTVACTILPPT